MVYLFLILVINFNIELLFTSQSKLCLKNEHSKIPEELTKTDIPECHKELSINSIESFNMNTLVNL